MSKTKTGGPAFPSQREHTAKEGMSLRDYFAAKAMQGLMVDVERPRGDYIAEMAYEVADAMLREREVQL